MKKLIEHLQNNDINFNEIDDHNIIMFIDLINDEGKKTNQLLLVENLINGTNENINVHGMIPYLIDPLNVETKRLTIDKAIEIITDIINTIILNNEIVEDNSKQKRAH